MPFYYKDFVPPQTAPGTMFVLGRYASLDAAVAAANEWVTQQQVEVIHIETVLLPNPFAPSEEGTADSHLHTAGEGFSYWTQFVRVWYRYADNGPGTATGPDYDLR
jgi:hypothetical protein